MLKRLFCMILIIAFGVTMGFAQTQIPTTQGTEFWVSFMRNGYRTTSSSNKLTLFASAKEACTVTVENPNTRWKTEFQVGDNNVASCIIPDNQGYNSQQGGTANKGLLVTADDTISLFFANETTNSYDASNVLPLQALGCEYMVQSYKSLGEQSNNHLYENRASFLIIATEDNTQVKITPTCETWDNNPANSSYIVSLDRGQCYHVLNKHPGSTEDNNGDFSGTRIESLDEKPIAVFNGNCITAVPNYVTAGYDHVFEQAMPIENWGNRFVVTSIFPHYGFDLQNDYVKITALYDHTIVKRDGVELTNPSELMAGESRVFEMDLTTDPYTFLESDNPIAVYLYNHSHRSSRADEYGDPSMVWISPVEQTIDEITFSTFPAANVRKHYVNIVCYTEHAAELMLDGNHVAEIRPVQSNPDFSYVRKEVFGDRTAHNIHCPGGFVAYVYGFGLNEGYAYTVGSSAKILTNQLYVNDILSTELPDGYAVCENDANIQFRAEVNYEFHHISWNFGDGTTAEGVSVSHEYTADDDYEVTAEVYREIEGGIQLSGSMQTTIHVMPQISAEPLDKIICENSDGFWWFDTLRTEPKTYHVLKPGVLCDTLFTLNLTIDTGPEHPDTTVVSCEPIYWGDTLCNETKDYYRPFTTEAGCEYDSVLHFQYVPSGDFVFEKDTCDYYVWLGHFYDEMGYHEYNEVVTGDNGCESYLTLKLTLHESPPFSEIIGLTQVAVATSYWPGEYIYRLDDSTGLDISTITWELQDNPAGPEQWELIPHGASCTVIAYSLGQRTLVVSSGDGSCDRENELMINCTAYGVGENEVGDLEVFPNPAKDEVRVRGSEIKEVVLYDLMGQKLKTVPVHNASEVSVNVGDLPQALYLLEVRTMRGNKTRRISVIR